MNNQEREFSFDEYEVGSGCEIESYFLKTADDEKRVKEPNKNAVINTTEINKSQSSLGI